MPSSNSPRKAVSKRWSPRLSSMKCGTCSCERSFVSTSLRTMWHLIYNGYAAPPRSLARAAKPLDILKTETTIISLRSLSSPEPTGSSAGTDISLIYLRGCR